MNAPIQASRRFFTTQLWCWSLAAFLLVTALCGCFQATNKFYLDSDIITDKRFEGRFGSGATNESPSGKQSLVIKLDKNKHYVATFTEGTRWIKLDAVLFKLGTNLFVDIGHLEDNGSEANPGGGPSGLDLIRIATAQKTHSAIRVQLDKQVVEFQFGYGNPVATTLLKEPQMKMKVQGEGAVLILEPTDKLRAFLAKVGNDNTIFSQKGRFIRIEK